MLTRKYPDGIDCAWCASDKSGSLGIFITAGLGPIPISALNYDSIPIEDIEEIIYTLPKFTNAILLAKVKRPDDFIELSERGFFVYDWTDINNTDNNQTNAYELVSHPEKPLLTKEVEKNINEIIEGVSFSELNFIENKFIDTSNHMKCVSPG